MNLRHAAVLMLSCSIAGLAVRAISQSSSQTPAQAPAAQTPAPATAPSAAPEAWHPRNLKVLPQTISHDELKKRMHEYERGLGVPCGYCHAQDPQTRQIDYASDDNPVKQTARVMIAMTNDINKKYLAQLGDRRYAPPVTCGNCHQGQADPPDFEPKPQSDGPAQK